MKSNDALRILSELTAYQWGMVTSAQASMHGITRLNLSRLTEAEHLNRLAHGVYKDSGAPSNQFEDLRAVWLSTDPKVMGEQRIQNYAHGVVVAGTSAAHLHEVGDLWADHHEFVSPKRRQSQRREIRYRQRTLSPRDVTLAHGLPTMTVERTLADLVEEVGDLSLVADTLRDAAFKRTLDLERLRELLSPLAERNGFKRRDGNALLNRLLETAGLDADAVARRVAADSSLGSRVAASYLGNLSKADLDHLVTTPEMQKSMRSFQESMAKMLQGALWRETPALSASVHASMTNLMNSGAFDTITKSLTAELARSDAIRRLTDDWGKSLSDRIASSPEILREIRSPQNVDHDDPA
ncbi:type IV toxin-antitoxin system AbiEi family antitoxin domain-containing protein [Nesterenkonia sp. E16_7]|uniref:type IV toxin-antitoxin system AbiEi family antitoxin domain-containing protein n=1 Tax=unclassified Nesterenkonia TaxID=2629769 RepID=UPI001A912EC3|nr:MULTISPECIES: type IV toxin-antitoxin system AbiEi family antitoxin domain-containing protein [unclassified Nesterenkonia]MBO0594861.1 type IV toxin-antitoxin system AbiEi family antitoxin domain-containing protein [Nesterenkonia sp. E16_10]MBO0597110.1 type IV toxin-antitoxin system AbiEi family antitoxin domain-containing protein [Nesterenkonia sp. E16_7]